jgi:hypothetical protein
MNKSENSKVKPEFTIPASLDYQGVLQKAREYFYNLDPNIIGVNVGPRRVKKSIRPNEYALVVYVLQKESPEKLDPRKVIPKEFLGLRTDVYAPLSVDAPKGTGDFVADRAISRDLSSIDWARLRELAVSPTAIPDAANVQDFGDVCVLQNDGTLVPTYPDGTRHLDFINAYQLFRTKHGDDYDFVTFFADTASGVPEPIRFPITSFHSPIYNDVQGIGTGPMNDRAKWGSGRLQSFHYITQENFPVWRYVMLQEFGHRFAAFAKYKDPVTGATMSDHFLGGFPPHWNLRLDNDKSPIDYDEFNWVELPNGQFRQVELVSDERTYSNLDLYLMGLLGPHEVGEFNMLRNLEMGPDLATDFTATPVRLNIQNFIDQEGQRIPNVAAAPKYWRQAFIVLTNDINKVHDLVDDVDRLRVRWEQDFSQATKGLGRVDTVLDVRTGRAADFTIIISSRHGFGSDIDYLKSIEADVLTVGIAKDFTFSCPNVNSAEAAVLMFQSRAVNSSKNIITINGVAVRGGISGESERRQLEW